MRPCLPADQVHVPCIAFFAAAAAQDEPLPGDALRPTPRDRALAGQGPGDFREPGNGITTVGTGAGLASLAHPQSNDGDGGGGDGDGGGGGSILGSNSPGDRVGNGDRQGDSGTDSVVGKAASPTRPSGQRRAQPCRACVEKDLLLQSLQAQVAEFQRREEEHADTAAQLRTFRSELQVRDTLAERLQRQAADQMALKQDALAKVEALRKDVRDRDEAYAILRARFAKTEEKQADEVRAVRVARVRFFWVRVCATRHTTTCSVRVRVC
jgi:hypothetical protein